MSREATTIIRPATVNDAAALLSIYAPVVRETTISFEFEPPTEADFANRIQRVIASDPWLVCERNGEVAGYAYASSYRDRPAYITTRETTVYVHPDHHGAGVGRQLLETLLTELRQRGAHVAIAVIALPNEASVALHERLDFRLTGIVHEVAFKLETWIDQGIWELPLAPVDT